MIHRDDKYPTSACWHCASSNLARTGSEVWCRACGRACYHECAGCGTVRFNVERDDTDDHGKHWLCEPCRDEAATKDRLDTIHPADALDYMLTGRWNG